LIEKAYISRKDAKIAKVQALSSLFTTEITEGTENEWIHHWRRSAEFHEAPSRFNLAFLFLVSVLSVCSVVQDRLLVAT
jgi:hypothetical protein